MPAATTITPSCPVYHATDAWLSHLGTPPFAAREELRLYVRQLTAQFDAATHRAGPGACEACPFAASHACALAVDHTGSKIAHPMARTPTSAPPAGSPPGTRGRPTSRAARPAAPARRLTIGERAFMDRWGYIPGDEPPSV